MDDVKLCGVSHCALMLYVQEDEMSLRLTHGDRRREKT